MLLERMGGIVTLEHPDGTTEDVQHVLWYDADASDQTVMDVQTRFINQARYKGDSKTLTLLWPKDALGIGGGQACVMSAYTWPASQGGDP